MRHRLRRLGAVAAAVLAGLPGVAAADAVELAATVCVPCHGEGGNSVIPTVPRLAGLRASYISKQLKDYLSGRRSNEMMAPVIASLDEGDVPGLAAHFAQQNPLPGEVREPQLLASGKAMYDDGNVASGVPACVGCHQERGVGNERNPRVAGQQQAYAIEQIQQFRSGKRTNDRIKAMRHVAERMTDEEIRAVAEYLAGL